MAYTQQIQQLYVAYFNRPADPGGLAYWEGIVETAKGDTTAVSAAFAASAEYKAAFAGMNNYGIVNTVYNNLFGHDADAGGLNFYANLLNNNTLSVNQIVATIAGGAQGTDAVAYSDKVAAAADFTTAVQASSPALIAYSGDAANALAKAFLHGVTDSTSLAAATTPAALAATINSVIVAGNPAAAAEIKAEALSTADAGLSSAAHTAALAANVTATTDANALSTALTAQTQANTAAAAVNVATLQTTSDTAAAQVVTDQTNLGAAQTAVAADQLAVTTALANNDTAGYAAASAQLNFDTAKANAAQASLTTDTG